MQTIMLWRFGVFSTATRWSPTRLMRPIEPTALVASASSAFLNSGSAQALATTTGAVVRADPGLIGLDDGVERRGIDVALLGQHGFQRAHAQLRLGQLRAVLVVMVMMMVVIVSGHGDLRRSDLSYTIAMPEMSRTSSASLAFADRIDRLIAAIGRAVAWLCLFVVVVQFAVVVLRYAFGIGSIWLTGVDHLCPCRVVHAGGGLDAGRGRPCPGRRVLCRRRRRAGGR